MRRVLENVRDVATCVCVCVSCDIRQMCVINLKSFKRQTKSLLFRSFPIGCWTWIGLFSARVRAVVDQIVFIEISNLY